MVRIGKAHPHEPIFIVRQSVQPGHGALGDPVGVVKLLGNIGWPDLHSAGVAIGGHILLTFVGDGSVAACVDVWMMLRQPQIVMGMLHAKVVGQLHMLKAAVRAGFAHGCHTVFVKVLPGTQPRLEMRLA